MLYLSSQEMKLNSVKRFDIGFPISDDRYLVGFSELVYAYGNSDHHVKALSVKITSNINAGTSITVNVDADMYDDNDHHANKSEISTITLSVFAFSEDEPLTNKYVTALTEFHVSYRNTDHHLKEYGTIAEQGTCFMQDKSIEHRSTGNVTRKKIALPQYLDAKSYEQYQFIKSAAFISDFAISKKESDCHILMTGIKAIVDSRNISMLEKRFIFRDKNNDQVLNDSETFINANVLCLVNIGENTKMAICPYSEHKRSDDPQKLTNVYEAFESINKNGIKLEYSGELDSGTFPSRRWQKSHIQGLALYTDMNRCIFSHSSLDDIGYLIFSAPGRPEYSKTSTADEGFDHPGGIQAIGDYLLVPCETCDDTKESYIRLYDMSLLKLNQPPKVCKNFVIHRVDIKATAAGITKYEDEYGDWFLIVVCNWGICDFYKARADRSLPECEFIHISQRNMTKIWSPEEQEYDVQCLNLVTEKGLKPTDKTETVYLVAFSTKEIGGPAGSFEDHAVLLSITPKVEKIIRPYEENVYDGLKTITRKSDKHLICDHSSAVGALGVHFRYGAALEVKDDKLVLYATGRNFSNSKVSCNYFKDIAIDLSDNEGENTI